MIVNDKDSTENNPYASHSWELSKVRITILLMNIVAILILCSACITQPDKQTETIDFSDVSGEREITLRDVADSLKYIPLESSDSCFIGTIMHVQFTQEYIYIHDRSFGRVMVFDLNGRYIKQIGRRGKGPGEYPYLFCFAADDRGHNIYIYSVGDQILHYHFEKGFISAIKTNFARPIFITRINDYFLFNVCYPNTLMSQGTSCFIVDSVGNIVKRLLTRGIARNATVNDLSGFNKYLNYGDRVMFWESKYDTIYEITGDFNVSARYALKYGKNHRKNIQDPVVFDQMIKDGAFTLTSFIEMPTAIVFNAIENGTVVQFMYLKKNRQLIRNIKENNAGLQNDIDYGPRIKFYGVISDRMAYALLWPYELKQFYQSIQGSPEHMLKWKNKLHFKEDNNPILIVCYLKK